ncbi:MAG: alpha/beta hydrolase [Robiginitomaculum sp.]|nr:MAG: alpha/beta hydrolase [Robiginitomaculum sp.]
MKNEITPGDVIRLEGLDLPPGARFHYIQNGDIRLRVMVVPSARADARGSVILQPGRTEFIEKYFETVEDFVRRGFAVLVVDPRGQGLSSRLLDDPMKSYVRDYEDYCDDLVLAVHVFKSDLPRPHIVMGHSMGGTIVLQTILSGGLNPAACLLTAPMLELQDLDSAFMKAFVKCVTWAGMKRNNLPFQAQRSGLPVPFRANKLTSDPNRYQLWATYFENHKRLRVGAPTFGWLNASLKSMKFVTENARHLNIPTLIIACGADPIVKPVSNHDFAEKSGAEIVNIAGALHEICLERDEYRDQFLASFDAFLETNAL